jgi:hypothetical protein
MRIAAFFFLHIFLPTARHLSEKRYYSNRSPEFNWGVNERLARRVIVFIA